MALYRCSSGSGGGSLTETVLWTNTSTSAGFTNQEVDISADWSTFDYIGFYCKPNKTDSDSNAIAMYFLPSSMIYPYTTNMRAGCCANIDGYNYSRNIRTVSGNNLKLYITKASTGSSNSDNYVLPIKIVGLK